MKQTIRLLCCAADFGAQYVQYERTLWHVTCDRPSSASPRAFTLLKNQASNHHRMPLASPPCCIQAGDTISCRNETEERAAEHFYAAATNDQWNMH